MGSDVNKVSAGRSDSPKPGLPDWAVVFGAFQIGYFFCFATDPSVAISEDWLKFYRPNLHFLFVNLGNVEIPWWNPHVGLGRPFVSDLQNAVFYPPTYLLALGETAGLHLSLNLHLFGALLGTRRLAGSLGARPAMAWLAGFALVFSGPYSGLLYRGMIFYVFGLCYLPWLMLILLRAGPFWNGRLVAAFGTVLALQFLTGHPQVFWISAVGLGLFVISWKLLDRDRRSVKGVGMPLLQMAAGAGVAVALTAVAWLPFLDLIAEGNRAEATPGQAAFGTSRLIYLYSLFCIPPYEFLVNAAGNWFIGATWTLTGLAGWLTTRDPRLRALLVVSAFALVFSFGDKTFLHGLCYELLPGTSMFRFPIRMSVWLAFALVLTGSVFLSRPASLDLLLQRLAGPFGLLLGALLIGFRLMDGQATLQPLWQPVIFLLAGTAVILLGHTEAPCRRHLPLALGLVMAVEFGAVNSVYQQKFSWAGRYGQVPAYPAARQVAELLAKLPNPPPAVPPPRANFPPTLLPRNYAMALGYAHFDAYTSLFLKRPWDALHASTGLGRFARLNTTLNEALYHRGPFNIPNVTIDFSVDPQQQQFVFNRDPFPRAHLSRRVRAVQDVAAADQALRDGHDVLQSTLWEGESPLARPGPADAPATPVRITHFASSEIRLSLETDAPAVLVLNEAWFPGWQARSGPTAIPVRPVNHWMRGLPLAAGRHEVVLTFRPRRIVPGFAVSLLSLGLLAGYAGRFRHRICDRFTAAIRLSRAAHS